MKVCLWGLPGSGKTTILPFLAEQLRLDAFDLDELIVQKHRQSIATIFQQFGEDYFRGCEAEQLRFLFENYDSFMLACGGGTPCFKGNDQFLLKNAVCVWLNPDIKTIYNRLLATPIENRPLFQNETNSINNLLALRYLRKINYQQAHIICAENSPEVSRLAQQITSCWLTLFCPE